MSGLLNEIQSAIQAGKTKDVKELVAKALDEGITAKDILEKGLLPGLEVISVKFKNNEVYIPEVLISARAMNAGTELLKPYLKDGDAKPIGKALIGTVRGDRHDIGKNLVRIMFEGKGIETIDLGVDVPPERFVEEYKKEKPDIIALSALLTTTMGEMKIIIDEFIKENLRNDVIIMIGGAPVTQSYCNNIGADIFAADAACAAEAAKQSILNKKGL